MDYEELNTLADEPGLTSFTDATEDWTMPREHVLLAWFDEKQIKTYDLNYWHDIPQDLPAHSALYYYNEADWPGSIFFNDKDDAMIFKLTFWH